jgi:predicted molibdopterin-dependent oxidoreductase YjgC
VAGRSNLAEAAEHTMAAVTAIRELVPQARVLPVLRRSNVRGAVQAGMVGSQNGPAPVLERAGAGGVSCLILLGADPIADVPDADLARRALAGARRVIAIDTHLTASSSIADVVLPAAGPHERSGTTTNLEGRVSPVAQRVTPRGTARADWMIAVEIAERLGIDLEMSTIDDLRAQMATQLGAFGNAVVEVAQGRGATDGVLGATAPVEHTDAAVLHAPGRNAYDFRLVVSRTLYDRAVGTVTSPHLEPLARSAALHVHSRDLERLGVRDGDSVNVVGARTSVVLPVVADDGVMRGCVWSPFNQTGADIRLLIDLTAGVTDVRVETL